MGFGSLNMRLKELFLHTRIPFRDGLVVGLVHPPTMNLFAYGSLGQYVEKTPSHASKPPNPIVKSNSLFFKHIIVIYKSSYGFLCSSKSYQAMG